MSDSADSEFDFNCCPNCGLPLYGWQEWELREGLTPGGQATHGDYVHADCPEADDE